MVKAIQIAAHVLPAVAVILVGIWMGSAVTSYSNVEGRVTGVSTAGFGWGYADSLVFNWHPLLMTLGFVFCSSQAALVYLTLPFTHRINKIIHASLHGVGGILALVGGVAVFRFHNEHGITNLYSLHSWLGVLVWILFIGQWGFGFVAYVYPGARPSVRAGTISYHIAGGIGILALIYATAALGVMEKLSFNGSCNLYGELDGKDVSGYMANDCVLGNIIGVVLALSLVTLILAIVQAKIVRHQAPPTIGEETSPLVNNSRDDRMDEKMFGGAE